MARKASVGIGATYLRNSGHFAHVVASLFKKLRPVGSKKLGLSFPKRLNGPRQHWGRLASRQALQG